MKVDLTITEATCAYELALYVSRAGGATGSTVLAEKISQALDARRCANPNGCDRWALRRDRRCGACNSYWARYRRWPTGRILSQRAETPVPDAKVSIDLSSVDRAFFTGVEKLIPPAAAEALAINGLLDTIRGKLEGRGRSPRTFRTEATSLYRFFDADHQLLYVGITLAGLARIGQHAAEKPWFTEVTTATFDHFPTRREAEIAEAMAIRDEAPRYNIVRPDADVLRLLSGRSA